ncbi:MAG: hypothetical protein J6Q25_05870 [Bacteroidales bacterium]|nr:hypothetical protein [Bacteroidales bacterium]
MKKFSLWIIAFCLFVFPLRAQEYVKTWLDLGAKQGFYASYSALYNYPLAVNYDLSAAFSFQWEDNQAGSYDATHAIAVQGLAYFPLNESSTRHFNSLALHQKFLFRDLSVWGIYEYNAALSLSYRRARWYGEIGCMHRILQDIHWTGHDASARYLNEPFGLVYKLAFQCRDPRTSPAWNLGFALSDYDDFLWERIYAPNVSLYGEWKFSERSRLISKLMYMPSGVFNLASSVYECYIRMGVVCEI